MSDVRRPVLSLALLLAVPTVGAAQQPAPTDAEAAGSAEETATGEAAAEAAPPADAEVAGGDETAAADADEAADGAPDEGGEGEPAEGGAAASAAAARSASAVGADAEASAGKAPAADLPPELAEVLREYEGFAAEIDEYRRDVSRVVEFEFERKRRRIQDQYQHVVDQLAAQERRRREDAIGRFEEFLAKYPENPRYTPDALFRLAELYFEKSNDTYITALEEYDRRYRAYEQGEIDQAPPEPRQDYRRTIELFDRLITQWPDYRRIDGAYYLKGYCLHEMGEDKAALQAFQTLVRRFPQSRFAAETWTRIGEHYFDYNQLPEAIAAYSRVLEFEDSPYYDKALYKLAWTHYRNDEYDQAVRRFRELIEFSDSQSEKTGVAGSDLRAEAIQYLAISLQEEDWDGDGLHDPDAGFARVLRYVKGDKPYEQEVLKALAEIYFDNAKYEESVETVRYLLRKFPDNPENPELHQQLIVAYERLRQFDEAFAERDVLARTYGEGSAWREANRDRPKVIAEADKLVEQALIQAATYHHHRAQELKKQALAGDPTAEDAAIREYRLAAVAYQNYLARYPRSENAYDLSFFYAECLYYSFRFAEAAEAYAKVRDSKLGTRYRETAAFSAILAHENHIQQLIREGRLEARPSLLNAPPTESEGGAAASAETAAAAGEAKTIEPEPLPEPVQALLAAREAYVKADLHNPDDPSRLPRVAYKIGELYFDYHHYDEARKWFSWLVERYPREKVTVFAANNIIESYRRVGDWQKMAEWSEIIAEANLGTEEDRKALAAEVRTLKVGALFKAAEELFAQGKYEQAAEEYIRLVEENPGNKFADRALNNAAVAFEKTRRFESATNTYERLYRNYPDSPHAENALFRVGINSERFYDFERAIRSHLKLVEDYPESEHRADSLFQAALLLERTQQYRRAAENFERYAELFPDRDDTAETFFRAARNYEKLGDTDNALRIYQTFVDRYGNDPNNNRLVIEALANIADIYDQRGRERQARRAYGRVIDEFNARGMAPGTYEARYPAKARFKQIEYDFERYAALKLVGSLNNQGRIIKEMQRQLKALQRQYAEVIEYKDFEWTLAAFYRVGQIYQLFAQALYDAPIPKNFDPEMEDMYRTQLEDIALPIEDEAIKRYELAYQKAREFRVTNEWTRRILQALNKYKPSDYPLFKEERRLLAERELTPPRLLPAPRPAGEAPDAPAEEPPAAAPTDAPAPAPTAPPPPADEDAPPVAEPSSPVASPEVRP